MKQSRFEHGVFWSVGCNPLTIEGGYFHCTKVSPGCDHCWAESIARKSGAPPYDDRPVLYSLDRRKLEVLRSLKHGRVVFLCHLMDLFHPRVPTYLVVEIFQALLAMPQHRFIILTKRAANAKAFFDSIYQREFGKAPLPWHIGLGVSCESHRHYIERAKLLRQIPAETKIVSFAPLLGRIGFNNPDAPALHAFEWVLIEGESIGPRAGRPCDLHWVRDIVMQAHCYAVPVYVKQVHIERRLVRAWLDLPPGLQHRQFPEKWVDSAEDVRLLPIGQD